MSNTRIIVATELTPTLDLYNRGSGGGGGEGSRGFSFSSILGPILRPRVDVFLNEGDFEASWSSAPYGEPVPGRLLIILLIVGAILYFMVPRKKG